MRNCCPNCQSKAFVKNGITAQGAQNHICKECNRQFVLDPQEQRISQSTRKLVEKLLLERLSLEGVCRLTGVSMQWLLNYISELYRQIPDDLGVQLPPDIEGVMLVRVEADELWSFVGSKKNRQWIWLALDITTRQVIALHIGGRETADAKQFWENIPAEFKEQCEFYTDQYDAYREAIPEEQLYQVKKKRSYKPYRKSELYFKTKG